MPDISAVRGDIPTLLESFELALRAERKSPHTIDRYTYGVTKFCLWLHDRGERAVAAGVTREHVRRFVEAELAAGKPSSAATRFGDLRAFFKFLVDEGELGRSPVAGMDPPKVPETLQEIVPDEVVRKLIADASGPDFVPRRDTALLWVFADTPLRKGAVAGLRLDDVDLREMVLTVTEKGSRPLEVPFSHNTARALDRYRRVRAIHPRAHEPWFWLGQRGRFTESGISQMVRERGEAVGVEGLHPHQFRATFAHNWLDAGGSEGDLMQLAGWESPAMPRKYAKSLSKQRAHEAYRRLGLSDRL